MGRSQARPLPRWAELFGPATTLRQRRWSRARCRHRRSPDPARVTRHLGMGCNRTRLERRDFVLETFGLRFPSCFVEFRGDGLRICCILLVGIVLIVSHIVLKKKKKIVKFFFKKIVKNNFQKKSFKCIIGKEIVDNFFLEKIVQMHFSKNIVK